MARASGWVGPNMTARNVKRRQVVSKPISVANGVTELVFPLLAAPQNSRVVIYDVEYVNATAISNHTAGTLVLGTATAAGTLTANNVLASTAITANTAQYIKTRLTSSLASTLKYSGNNPSYTNCVVIPKDNTLVATFTAMASSGTGSVSLIVSYSEMEDESGKM